MKKVLISPDGNTLVVIDDCDGKTDGTNYFGILQCPKKEFKKKVSEFEEQGFTEYFRKE
jgi:hypothetical protein